MGVAEEGNQQIGPYSSCGSNLNWILNCSVISVAAHNCSRECSCFLRLSTHSATASGYAQCTKQMEQ